MKISMWTTDRKISIPQQDISIATKRVTQFGGWAPGEGCFWMRLFCLQLEASCLQWSFLLTVDKFSFFTYSWSFCTYIFSFLIDNVSFFTYSWSSCADNGKVRLISALRDCKQRSLTVSKKAPTASEKASPVVSGHTLWCGFRMIPLKTVTSLNKESRLLTFHFP